MNVNISLLDHCPILMAYFKHFILDKHKYFENISRGTLKIIKLAYFRAGKFNTKFRLVYYNNRRRLPEAAVSRPYIVTPPQNKLYTAFLGIEILHEHTLRRVEQIPGAVS